MVMYQSAVDVILQSADMPKSTLCLHHLYKCVTLAIRTSEVFSVILLMIVKQIVKVLFVVEEEVASDGGL